MSRAILILSCLLLAGCATAYSVKQNDIQNNLPAEQGSVQIAEGIAEGIVEDPERPAIVTLQQGNPTRQCAGVGQACSAHGDCCTNSCFGLLRSCVPNLGFSLNLQIGAPTGT